VTPTERATQEALEAALDEVADELYALPPEDFTAARAARVKAARAAGDRALATAIGTLRRPTTGAWVVNTLARERADRLAELLDLGEQLRAAQERLVGAELRRLSEQRREVVAGLTREAAELATARGHRPSDAVAREVETTLDAALADEAAGAAARSGRLTTALAYAGMGPVDLEGAVATPPRAPVERARTRPTAAAKAGASAGSAPKGTGSDERRERRRQVAEEAERAARSALDDAERAAAEHAESVAAAEERHSAAKERLAELQQRLAAARDEEASAAQAVRVARHAAEVADRSADAARRRAEKAGAAVAALRPDDGG